tara:strand:- start:36 stop:245 length:210 start_codon:yes stop_codon:yes gene_type:complete
MKIFLTEIDAYGSKFSGPNIIASTIERAEEAATQNGLIVVGELDSIYINDELEQEHLNTIPKKDDRTVH